MTTHHEKMKSDIGSTINSLVAPTSKLSCADANQKISAICNDYINTCAQPSTQSAVDQDDDDEDYHGNSTPGAPKFFLDLWETVIDHVHNAPVDQKAHDEHITRLVNLVGEMKQNSWPTDELVVFDEKCGWKDLPLLGQTIRDVYNEPIDTMSFDSSALLSTEGQSAVAGASQNIQSESDAARLAKARHRWLSLQSFISRLWRDCDCSDYALYALWALRSGLEDWPDSTTSNTFEESPAYLAFQVEAAAIWIINTAPLMYKCTKIWGPNGNAEWPKNAGAPGRGGKRWDGVDGYDSEHKRWGVWKGVLGEVVKWCDGKDGWKVRDAAVRALEVMQEVER